LSSFGTGFGVGDDEIVDDRIDEAPWTPGRGKGKRKTKPRVGAENASDCLNWSTSKILEHEGFQGAFDFLDCVSVGLSSVCG